MLYTNRIRALAPGLQPVSRVLEGTAPAVEFDLSQDDLCEIEDIMQDAVMVGGPSPEGV